MPKVPKIKDVNHYIKNKEFRCQNCGIEYAASNFQDSHPPDTRHLTPET